MLILLLALQLATSCPASLKCDTVNWLQARPTVVPITTIAHPEQPAKWFLLAETVEVGIFESWALDSGHKTVSQMAQQESRDHHVVRWGIVAGMAMLTWHLAWGFPW